MFHVKHRKENKMKIQLYRNMSDTRKLDKNLAKLAEVTCHLKDNTSVFEPTFIISEKNMKILAWKSICRISRCAEKQVIT